MSTSDSQPHEEIERQTERLLAEAGPQIEKVEREIAALYRQLPGWEEGLSETAFLYPLLQRVYGLSWEDLARLNPCTRKMYLEDLIRHTAATNTEPASRCYGRQRRAAGAGRAHPPFGITAGNPTQRMASDQSR